jgi:hypothetical protein
VLEHFATGSNNNSNGHFYPLDADSSSLATAKFRAKTTSKMLSKPLKAFVAAHFAHSTTLDQQILRKSRIPGSLLLLNSLQYCSLSSVQFSKADLGRC